MNHSSVAIEGVAVGTVACFKFHSNADLQSSYVVLGLKTAHIRSKAEQRLSFAFQIFC